MGTLLFRTALIVPVFALRASLPAAEGLGPDGAALFLDLSSQAGPPPGLRLHGPEWAAEAGGLEFSGPLQYAELDEDSMARFARAIRSEEHTSELQSLRHL